MPYFFGHKKTNEISYSEIFFHERTSRVANFIEGIIQNSKYTAEKSKRSVSIKWI